ncbi:MAG: CHAT domain-containing protein [Limnobacter sp.]|nr:CHAT domain-containing protein [Limnobacter sp.]
MRKYQYWTTGIIFTFWGLMICGKGVYAQQQNIKIEQAMLGDVENATALAIEGERLYDADSTKKSWGDYCGNSITLAEAGRFREAVREATKALYLGVRDKNQKAQVFAMRDLAYAYGYAGDLEKSRVWVLQSLENSKRLNNPNFNVAHQLEAAAYKLLGDLDLKEGQLDLALKNYNMGLERASFFTPRRDYLQISIASVLIQKGDYEQARKILQEHTGNTNSNTASLVQRTLSELNLLEKRYDDAYKGFQSSLEIARKSNKKSRAAMWSAFGMAKALHAQGKSTEAELFLEQALFEAEGLRANFQVEEFKTAFFAQAQDIFDWGVALYIGNGKSDLALAVSERGRARTALDLLRDRVKVVNKDKALDQAKLSPENLLNLIPPNIVVLNFYVTKREVYLWELRTNAIKSHTISVNENELSSKVSKWRSTIEAQQKDALIGANDLGKLLLGEITFKPQETVVFIPHKMLHRVPPHALRLNDKFLVEDHAVGVALSLGAVQETLRKPRKSEAGLLALGNPDLNDPVMDLPGAEDEVRAIVELIPTPLAYFRKEANRQNFLNNAQNTGIIHVAAHSVVDEIDPMFSKLKLSEGDIEAREFYELNLQRSNLVVLSSCSSGLGKISKGDEFWGFKRSILISGTDTLVLSLWQVEDLATSKFMKIFYKNFRAKGATQAMRSAYLELLTDPKSANINSWAPFTSVGLW